MRRHLFCSLSFLSFLFLCVFVGGQKAGEEKEERRLISFNETYSEWMVMSEVEQLAVDRVNFIDITDYQNNYVYTSAARADPLPTQPIHKVYVTELIPALSTATLQSNLETLTAFNTRYYTSTTGVEAAKWILAKFEEYKDDRDDITVEFFTHTWQQPSVVATIPGVGPSKDQFVVIGAHEDSVGSTSTGRSPGADDDGSGTVTVLEIFRVLVDGGHYPDRTLKFITYAAEEVGLRGSSEIATAFRNNNSDVYAVLQLDMTGYGGIGDIGVVGDNVDLDLTAFVKILIDSYSLLDWVDTKCGYGCSDHASWTRSGYRSAFPFETAFNVYNPYIHTANDIISHLTFDRILEFAKIGLGFVVELGGNAIRP